MLLFICVDAEAEAQQEAGRYKQEQTEPEDH